MPSKSKKGTKPGKRALKPPKWVLHELWLEQHGEEYRAALFRNVKKHLPELDALRDEAITQLPGEPAHPFDSPSFEECCRLKPLIQKMATALQELLPDRPMRKYFLDVVSRAIAPDTEPANPEQALQEARTIVDGFHRAYCYLAAACEAGKAAELPGKRPPHWWTTLLWAFELC